MNIVDIVDYLRQKQRAAVDGGGLNSFFAVWCDGQSVSTESLQLAIQTVASKAGALRTYREVAALGYAAHARLLDQSQTESLREGLRWITGRSTHIEGQPADFCTDAVALLGLALGLNTLEDDKAKPSWLPNKCTIPQTRTENWQRSLIALAHEICGGAGGSLDAEEVKIVAYARGLSTDPPDSASYNVVVNHLRITELGHLDEPHAILTLAALRYIEQTSPIANLTTPSSADVIRILREVPRGLQRWTWEEAKKTPSSQARKWQIDHEYHVQNLVWLLLSPIFPDAKPEEYKSSVGVVRPRIDVAIPSLRLIVEVKFWRSNAGADKMIREIAEDSGLYLTADAPYTAIVPFIWDNASRTEEHPMLISGLKTINGIFDAVVVSRPARMRV